MIHARRHFYRMSCSCPRPPVAAWTQPLCAAVPSGAKNTVCMDGAALQRLIAGLTAFPPRYQSCALPKPHRSRSQGRGGARTAGRGFGGLPNHRGHMRRPGQRRAMSTSTTPPTHKHAPLRAAKITAIRRHLVRLCSFSSLHASVGLFNPLSFLLAQPSLHPCTPHAYRSRQGIVVDPNTPFIFFRCCLIIEETLRFSRPETFLQPANTQTSQGDTVRATW